MRCLVILLETNYADDFLNTLFQLVFLVLNYFVTVSTFCMLILHIYCGSFCPLNVHNRMCSLDLFAVNG